MAYTTRGSGRFGIRALGITIALIGSALWLAACGSGGAGNAGGGLASRPASGDATLTKTIDSMGGQLQLTPAVGQTVRIGVPANAVSGPVSMTFTQVGANELPLSITRTARSRFTPNSNNIYIFAFTLMVNPTTVTRFNVPLTVDASGIVPNTIQTNTIVNMAYLQNAGTANAAYIDVATFKVGSAGALQQNLASAALPGLQAPGTYVLYVPAPGTGTAVANYGIALIADDGASTGILQVVNLFDATGEPLAVPTIKALSFPGANDIDGQALTPDGSQGILVDGGNTVRFFSGSNTGVTIASMNTVDITAYGGDGDSVAILPNGDTAIVSGDSDQLLVISGITSGHPMPAATIQCPGARDGLIISNDGKTLLARGNDALTVFAVAPTPTTTGPLGGTVSYTFTQTANLTNLGSGGLLEDGRDGMAISPADSSRAVVIGYDTNNAANITEVSGLPGAPVTRSVHLRLPRRVGSRPVAPPEKGEKPSAAKTRIVLSGVSQVWSVAVTPDGTSAIVGTDVGLVQLSGLNTDNLSQLGTAPFNPTYQTPNASAPSNSTTYNLNSIRSLGITLDGKYVVVCSNSPGFATGSLLMYPIVAPTSTAPNGFGTAVSQLNGVAIPNNDQILIH